MRKSSSHSKACIETTGSKFRTEATSGEGVVVDPMRTCMDLNCSSNILFFRMKPEAKCKDLIGGYKGTHPITLYNCLFVKSFLNPENHLPDKEKGSSVDHSWLEGRGRLREADWSSRHALECHNHSRRQKERKESGSLQYFSSM